MRDPHFIGRGDFGKVETDVVVPVARFDYKTRARASRRLSARRREQRNEPETKPEGESRTVFDDQIEEVVAHEEPRVLAASTAALDAETKVEAPKVAPDFAADFPSDAVAEGEDDAPQFRFDADGQLEFLPLKRREVAPPTAPVEPLRVVETISQTRVKASAQGVGIVAHAAMLFAPLLSFVYDLQMHIGQGVRVERQRVQLADYPRSAAPLRIAFISDLHYGPTSGRVAARQAWQRAREAEPDILLLGGDFVYADERGLPTLFREVQRWRNALPNCPIFACLGNHDHLADVESLITGLEACGARVLVNEAQELPAPWKGVHIVGADDARFGDPQLELALSTVPRGACAIMLAHSPEICEDAALKRCTLTLCGDTHGGQICLPNGEAPFMIRKWGRQYTAGLHRHAGNYVFVSRGVGAVGLPIRFFAPPDVALLEVCGGIGSAARAASTRASDEARDEPRARFTAPGEGHVKIIRRAKSEE